jgi:Dyp-type peroxidase family
MITDLDLADIQGNIVKAYGRYGFPVARHVLYHITNPESGRQFVAGIAPLVTTSVPWLKGSEIPTTAINIAFTYQGLRHLDIPDDTMHGFPDEFSMGMKARRDILGDVGPNHPSHWDPVWEQEVHILVSINAKDETALEAGYQKIEAIFMQMTGIIQLTGHRGPDGGLLEYQPASALVNHWDKEHFGYSDGISNPDFEGCGEDPANVIGGGKPTGKDPATMEGWAPIKAGEFLFGHADEAGGLPEAPGPPLFSRNGTFLVYRKLHQNVKSFESYLDDEGRRFPGGKEALAAKFAGRWRNGAPLALFPTQEAADAFVAEYYALKKKGAGASATDKARLAQLESQWSGFDFNNDLEGARCPFGAHVRRVNPRSALMYAKKGAFGHDAFDSPGALSNRRRLLRRGLPYGLATDPPTDDGDHGVVMLIVSADLSRQFEFVQQQWMAYGNDFNLANDTDPLLGNHGANENCRADGRMMIEGDKATGKPPYFCGGIPTLVETRGGEYFFVPSMTCLRMIALGIIDPT